MSEDRVDAVDLDTWLAPFLAAMGRKTRRHWGPLYLRGLLGPGDRKSLQPMAERLGLSGHDQLQHFIASPTRDDAPLWAELARQADQMLGGPDALLVIDDTALPKQGTHSVGVARQYCGALGKKANCQSLVSLTLARDEVPLPLGLHLFLPEEWTNDPARCARAGVPETACEAHGKGEIALSELDRLREVGVRFGTVLADAGYGSSAAFRHALDERSLRWASASRAPRRSTPPTSPSCRRPVAHASSSRTRTHGTVEAVLDERPWRRVTWRQGTKGKLSARFSALQVRVADGPVFGNNRHLPGAEVWLVGEWRSSGERKYYLSNLPARITRRALVGAIKARWVCEPAHQQLEEELGLDHFEGRSWTGLHRHALMTCLAFTYLQHRRLAGTTLAGRGKNEGPASGAAALAEPAGRAPGHHRPAVRGSSPTRSVPLLPEPLQAAA